MGYVVVILAIAALFFLAERLWPGRDFPQSSGWYVRAIFLNTCQFGVVWLAAISWDQWLRDFSLMNIAGLPAVLQGGLGWFIGTFLFYWWHRARHEFYGLWVSLHQIHHSPSRIEILTAFYKHPLEIAANSLIISLLLLVVLGASPEGAVWFNLFAATGELFYHANIKTPHWMGYFMQRPEHHSIHHEIDVHDFNFGDITWWDRLFGTFKDTQGFSEQCGFHGEKEKKLLQMLAFKDVY